MSAAVQERLMVRMAGVARPSAAEYSTTLGAWADAYQEAGGGLLPPRRVEPVFADPDGNPMVVRPGWDGPTAFPFPGTVPSPAADPAAPGFVGAAGGSGYAAAAEANFARRAAGIGDGDRPDGGEPPDDGGVFGDLKRQVGGYLARVPAQVAQSLLKSALTNAILGGGSGGLSQLLSGSLGALVPGLGGAAGTLGSVLGGLANGAGPLGGVVGSLTGGCFAAGPAGIAFDPSAALSQLGGQLLNQWQVEDSDSMGEQLAHHTVNKYADQMQDPQAALDKLTGYFTGAAAVALFAAVRLADSDGVGDPVLAGAATVLVEGLPQARVGDPVLVPGVAVYMGAATVLTEGRMSARAGTSVSQAGPIPKGAATVFINGPPGGTPPPPKPPPAPPKPPAAAAQKPSAPAAKGGTNQSTKPTEPRPTDSGKSNDVGAGSPDAKAPSESTNPASTAENLPPVEEASKPMDWRERLAKQLEDDEAQMTYRDPTTKMLADGVLTDEEHLSREKYNYCPPQYPSGTQDGIDYTVKRGMDNKYHDPLKTVLGRPTGGAMGPGSFECTYDPDTGASLQNSNRSGTFNLYNSNGNISTLKGASDGVYNLTHGPDGGIPLPLTGKTNYELHKEYDMDTHDKNSDYYNHNMTLHVDPPPTPPPRHPDTNTKKPGDVTYTKPHINRDDPSGPGAFVN